MNPEEVFLKYKRQATEIIRPEDITKHQVSYLEEQTFQLFFYDKNNGLIYTYYWDNGEFTLSILVDIEDSDGQIKKAEIASLIEVEYDNTEDDITSELYLSNYTKIKRLSINIPDVINTGSKTIRYLISIANLFYINRIIADDHSELICKDGSKIPLAIVRMIAGYDTLYVKLGFIPENITAYQKLKSYMINLGNIPMLELYSQNNILNSSLDMIYPDDVDTKYTLSSYLRNFLNSRNENICTTVSNIIKNIRNNLKEESIISIYYVPQPINTKLEYDDPPS